MKKPIIASLFTVAVVVGWLSWFGFWSSSILKGFAEGMMLSPSLSPREASEGYVFGIGMAGVVYLGLIAFSVAMVSEVWNWATSKR